MEQIKSKDFKELDTAMDLLWAELELTQLPEGITLQIEKGESLEIVFSDQQILIRCKERVQIFRALGLLIQHLKDGEKSVALKEEIQFERSGVMLDVSRNAVLKTDTIKRLLRYMAVMGLNTMYLYMEDVYEVEEYPYFGYMRGRYSFQELWECDRYAEQFGIEIVPCIQTLGHLESALRWPYAKDIKDTEGVLLVGEEKTYQFIESLIRAASKPFRSKRIHLGMDEAWYLGAGNYQRKNGYRSSFEIMEEHLTRVTEITNRYGLEPMIWSDMFFRLGSETHDYYDPESQFSSKLKEKIPQDLGLVYWDYYHTRPEEYELYLEKHKELGSNISFAGGIWNWYGMAPKHSHTVLSTNSALEICKKYKVKDVFATVWGDNGAEVNIMTALYGMQLYAEHTYHRSPNENEIRKRFAFCVKEPVEAYIALAKVDELPGRKSEPWEESCANPSKWLLWQDILCGLFDWNLPDIDLHSYYQDLKEEYCNAKIATKSFQLVYDFYEKLSGVLAIKWDLGFRIQKLYQSNDKKELQEIADEELSVLSKQVKDLRVSHRTLWFSTNKTFGFDILDLRYGGLLTRIETAQYLLKQYIAGDLERIEELEQERLPYSEQEIPSQPFYHLIATVSPFI